jgi:hypothetical protein
MQMMPGSAVHEDAVFPYIPAGLPEQNRSKPAVFTLFRYTFLTFLRKLCFLALRGPDGGLAGRSRLVNALLSLPPYPEPVLAQSRQAPEDNFGFDCDNNCPCTDTCILADGCDSADDCVRQRQARTPA